MPVDLANLVPQVVDMLAPPAHITIAIRDELPVVMGEQTRIAQVFQNLLSNAIKYMDKPHGVITVGCSGDHRTVDVQHCGQWTGNRREIP